MLGSNKCMATLESFASGQSVCVLTKENNIAASCFMDRMPVDSKKETFQPFVALVG